MAVALVMTPTIIVSVVVSVLLFYLCTDLYTKKPPGFSTHEAASEVAKTLSNKRREVLMAPSLPKVAIYARSFFPNFFFAVMAAGVKDTTNTKM